MIRYLLFNTKQEADDRSKQALHDYDPNPIEGTYFMFGCVCNNDMSLFALIIPSDYEYLLTIEELEALQTYEQLKELGFFNQDI